MCGNNNTVRSFYSADYKYKSPYKEPDPTLQFDWSDGMRARVERDIGIFTAIALLIARTVIKTTLKSGKLQATSIAFLYRVRRTLERFSCVETTMAVPLLTLNSLLPSQSLFNEIQSIHETGFFHELDSFFCCKDGVPPPPASTQVCPLQHGGLHSEAARPV